MFLANETIRPSFERGGNFGNSNDIKIQSLEWKGATYTKLLAETMQFGIKITAIICSKTKSIKVGEDIFDIGENIPLAEGLNVNGNTLLEFTEEFLPKERVDIEFIYEYIEKANQPNSNTEATGKTTRQKREKTFADNKNYRAKCAIFSPYGAIKQETIMSSDEWKNTLVFDVSERDFADMFEAVDPT